MCAVLRFAAADDVGSSAIGPGHEQASRLFQQGQPPGRQVVHDLLPGACLGQMTVTLARMTATP